MHISKKQAVTSSRIIWTILFSGGEILLKFLRCTRAAIFGSRVTCNPPGLTDLVCYIRHAWCCASMLHPGMEPKIP